MACLHSDGLLALWKAALGYDPGRGAKFSTFAAVSVQHACSSVLTRASAKKRSGIFLGLDPHDGHGAAIAARQPAVGAALEAREELDRLPPDLVAEAELAAEGWKRNEIDEAAGCTRQASYDRRRKLARRFEGGVVLKAHGPQS